LPLEEHVLEPVERRVHISRNVPAALKLECEIAHISRSERRGLAVLVRGASAIEKRIHLLRLVPLLPSPRHGERTIHSWLPAHATTPKTSARPYATTVDGSKESSRSSSPPCPGIQLLMSLTLRS